MNTLTLVATLAMGGLLSFTGAADAHIYGRHASTRHEYSRVESRADWQATDRSDFAIGLQPVPNDLVAKPEGSGQPGGP